MGVKFSDIVDGKPLKISELSGKVLCVDAFNMLYQFLTTIRGPDGSPLTNAQGEVTSHLTGLFWRVTKLMQEGIKFVFVFDGEAPDLKKKERERRRALKEQAQVEYERAVAEQDTAGMAKFAGRTARLTPQMIVQAQELLRALGVPVVIAPSEGEAQAAHMVHKGDAFAVVSQDFDCLLFGAPRVVRNLSVGQRRRKPGTFATQEVEPQVVTLADVLNELGVSLQQLRCLGLLVGTDFNVGGVKGLGPKKGLKLVKERVEPARIFEEANWSEYFDVGWQDVLDVFEKVPVSDEYELVWSGVDEVAVKRLLVDTHGFSEARVQGVLDKLVKSGQDRRQKSLGDFFG
jgi:flap endonuclease-1